MLKSIFAAVAAFAFVMPVLASGEADGSKAGYPLETCVVSDEKLGEHGKPFVFEHEGREVQLCCKSCLKDFKKDPAKYLGKLDAAAKP